uniref:NmrA family NAD(P)-binding protein n=1 Tax=Sphingopyxis fribergensis TaxID=1515612 RepID=UPI00389B2FCB
MPIRHSFVSLAFFYTNLLEYYVPQMEGDTLLMPIYLPEDFRAPFVDPTTATGPAVLSVLSNPETFEGKTLPIVGDIIDGAPRRGWTAKEGFLVPRGMAAQPAGEESLTRLLRHRRSRLQPTFG